MNTEVLEPEVLPQIKEIEPAKEDDPWEFEKPKINPHPKGDL